MISKNLHDVCFCLNIGGYQRPHSSLVTQTPSHKLKSSLQIVLEYWTCFVLTKINLFPFLWIVWLCSLRLEFHVIFIHNICIEHSALLFPQHGVLDMTSHLNKVNALLQDRYTMLARQATSPLYPSDLWLDMEWLRSRCLERSVGQCEM